MNMCFFAEFSAFDDASDWCKGHARILPSSIYNAVSHGVEGVDV